MNDTQIQPPLRVRLLTPRAQVPAYKSELAAGMDLAACLTQEQEAAGGIVVAPIVKGGKPTLVPCGIAMAIAPGYEGQVRARSGLAAKFGVTVVNSPGTIDADYRGEVMVALVNLGQEAYTVVHGARIAQLVIAPVAAARVEVVESLDETVRGSGGFGSTGVIAKA